MKYTSALITDARNKLGGDVFARNRAGEDRYRVCRRRKVPRFERL